MKAFRRQHIASKDDGSFAPLSHNDSYGEQSRKNKLLSNLSKLKCASPLCLASNNRHEQDEYYERSYHHPKEVDVTFDVLEETIDTTNVSYFDPIFMEGDTHHHEELEPPSKEVETEDYSSSYMTDHSSQTSGLQFESLEDGTEEEEQVAARIGIRPFVLPTPPDDEAAAKERFLEPAENISIPSEGSATTKSPSFTRSESFGDSKPSPPAVHPMLIHSAPTDPSTMYISATTTTESEYVHEAAANHNEYVVAQERHYHQHGLLDLPTATYGFMGSQEEEPVLIEVVSTRSSTEEVVVAVEAAPLPEPPSVERLTNDCSAFVPSDGVPIKEDEVDLQVEEVAVEPSFVEPAALPETEQVSVGSIDMISKEGSHDASHSTRERMIRFDLNGNQYFQISIDESMETSEMESSTDQRGPKEVAVVSPDNTAPPDVVGVSTSSSGGDVVSFSSLLENAQENEAIDAIEELEPLPLEEEDTIDTPDVDDNDDKAAEMEDTSKSLQETTATQPWRGASIYTVKREVKPPSYLPRESVTVTAVKPADDTSLYASKPPTRHESSSQSKVVYDYWGRPRSTVVDSSTKPPGYHVPTTHASRQDWKKPGISHISTAPKQSGVSVGQESRDQSRVSSTSTHEQVYGSVRRFQAGVPDRKETISSVMPVEKGSRYSESASPLNTFLSATSSDDECRGSTASHSSAGSSKVSDLISRFEIGGASKTKAAASTTNTSPSPRAALSSVQSAGSRFSDVRQLEPSTGASLSAKPGALPQTPVTRKAPLPPSRTSGHRVYPTRSVQSSSNSVDSGDQSQGSRPSTPTGFFWRSRPSQDDSEAENVHSQTHIKCGRDSTKEVFEEKKSEFVDPLVLRREARKVSSTHSKPSWAR